MSDAPTIPFGFKRIYGVTQRGDGEYDRATGKFVKVRKEWPTTRLDERVFIRKCEVVQTEIAGVASVPEMDAALFEKDAACILDNMARENMEAAGVPSMDLDA